MSSGCLGVTPGLHWGYLSVTPELPRAAPALLRRYSRAAHVLFQGYSRVTKGYSSARTSCILVLRLLYTSFTRTLCGFTPTLHQAGTILTSGSNTGHCVFTHIHAHVTWSLQTPYSRIKLVLAPVYTRVTPWFPMLYSGLHGPCYAFADIAPGLHTFHSVFTHTFLQAYINFIICLHRHSHCSRFTQILPEFYAHVTRGLHRCYPRFTHALPWIYTRYFGFTQMLVSFYTDVTLHLHMLL